ncbi:hypothetical protein D3C73_655180 [compost metagenome]
MLHKQAGRAFIPFAKRHGGPQNLDRLAAGCAQIPLETGKHQFEQVATAREDAQDIERHDVAGAFPDRVDRCFPVVTRDRAFLHVTVATKAFHCLVDQRRGDLAVEIFDDRGHDAGKGRFRRIAGGAIEGVGKTETERRRCSNVQCHIGKHARHQRLIDELAAEHIAAAGEMNGLGERCAHDASRSDRAIKPRQRDHIEDGANTRTRFTEQITECIGELDFGRRVGAITDLVLQPLELQTVGRTVFQKTRNEEAADIILGLCQHDETVTHRCRHEPFVAIQAIDALTYPLGSGAVGAHVGAALLFRHAHAERYRAFLHGRTIG